MEQQTRRSYREERTRPNARPEQTQHSVPEQHTVRAPRRAAKPKKQADRPIYAMRAILVGFAAVGVFVVLFTLLVAVGAFAYFHSLDLILPGVNVGGVEVGGMTVDEAALAINAGLNATGEITIAAEDRTWKATPAEFGLTVDSAATAVRAGAVGRTDSPVIEAFVMLDSTLQGTPVTPVVAVDQEKARAGLTEWAKTIDLPPQNASLKIENGTLVAVPGSQGYSLDVEATVAALAQDPGLALRNGYLPLVLIPVAPGVVDASAALEQARAFTAAPLQVTIYDAIVDETIDKTITPEEIAAWLSVQEGGESLGVIVDPAKVATYLQQIGDGLGQGRSLDGARLAPDVIEALKNGQPAFLLVSHLPTTYTVEPGDTLTGISWKVGMPYWRILDANTGLDANAINPGETLNIPSKDVLLPLPVIPGKRLVLSISDQRLRGYENKQQVFEYIISTGIDRSPTQPGIFQVQTHDPNAYASLWDLYMPSFLGIYESWPGFMNGFHGLPLLSGGTRLWGDILGRPASYGCIILSLDDGEALYNWAPDGVVVEIRE